MMKENVFSRSLRKKLEEMGITCYRIDAPIMPGIPDIHFVSKSGTSGWIETKVEKRMPGRMPYRSAQPIWLNNYHEAGGRCFTILFVHEDDVMIVVPGRFSIEASKSMERIAGSFLLRCSDPGVWLRLRAILLGS